MVTDRSLYNKKILITCGPTWSPIDDVRVISNTSSGTLGHMLALKLIRQGAKVTLLEGPVTGSCNVNNIRILKFRTFNEFDRLLRKELSKKFDCVIHAAAVSDYKIKTQAKSKIRSGLKELRLTLVPTKKIINGIKRLSPKSFLVGFKLESNVNRVIARQQALKLFIKAKCDLVLVNSAKENRYRGFLVDDKGNLLANAKSRGKITDQLVKQLEEKL